jgi:hypothetical protein
MKLDRDDIKSEAAEIVIKHNLYNYYYIKLFQHIIFIELVF